MMLFLAVDAKLDVSPGSFYSYYFSVLF